LPLFVSPKGRRFKLRVNGTGQNDTFICAYSRQIASPWGRLEGLLNKKGLNKNRNVLIRDRWLVI
jgi:hypothetical protein